MYPFVTTDPLPPQPIRLDLVTKWLRVGDRVDEDTILGLLLAACQWAENVCDRALFARTYTATIHPATAYPLRGMLPRNVAVTLPDSLSGPGLPYEGETTLTGSLLQFATLPTSAVHVSYRAGYETGEIPKDLETALLVFISGLYDSRGDGISERQTKSEVLLRPYKHYST